MSSHTAPGFLAPACGVGSELYPGPLGRIFVPLSLLFDNSEENFVSEMMMLRNDETGVEGGGQNAL